MIVCKIAHMNQNSHLLQPFLRYQSAGLVVEQSLNWLHQGAVVVDQPWAGTWWAISKDTRQSRLPCWKTFTGTRCSLSHKVHPNQIICLWFFPKSCFGPPSGVKNAPNSLIYNHLVKFRILWTATISQMTLLCINQTTVGTWQQWTHDWSNLF